MSDWKRREALISLARLVVYGGGDDAEQFERILAGLAESPTPELFRELCQAVRVETDLASGVITWAEVDAEISAAYPEWEAAEIATEQVDEALDALLTPALRLPLDGIAPYSRTVEDIKPVGGVL